MILKRVELCILIGIIFHCTSYTSYLELYNSLGTSVYYCFSTDDSGIQGRTFKELASQATSSMHIETQECTIAISLQAPITGTQITLYTIQTNPIISTIHLKIHACTNGTISIIPDKRVVTRPNAPEISYKDILVKHTPYQAPIVEPKIEIKKELPVIESTETVQVPVTTIQQSEPEFIATTVKIIEENQTELVTAPAESQETSSSASRTTDSTITPL